MIKHGDKIEDSKRLLGMCQEHIQKIDTKLIKAKQTLQEDIQ